MKRIIFMAALLGILFSFSSWSSAQGDVEDPGLEVEDPNLLIREGKQIKRITVLVIGYLKEDILEVTVDVRIPNQRPKITDVLFTGPKLGKIHYRSREIIPPSVEDDEEETYPITKVDGMVMLFGKRTKEKPLKGRQTKELFKMRIPIDEIDPEKKYQLWVEVETKTSASARIPKFKFDLEKLAELIEEQNSSEESE